MMRFRTMQTASWPWLWQHRSFRTALPGEQNQLLFRCDRPAGMVDHDQCLPVSARWRRPLCVFTYCL